MVWITQIWGGFPGRLGLRLVAVVVKVGQGQASFIDRT
jgi:hypothetical protein